ncbi:hypothetical protein FQZ97_969350 [compost metagenome]
MLYPVIDIRVWIFEPCFGMNTTGCDTYNRTNARRIAQLKNEIIQFQLNDPQACCGQNRNCRVECSSYLWFQLRQKQAFWQSHSQST